MKRAVTALALTAAGLVLVLNFNTRGAISTATPPATVQPGPATSASEPATTPSAAASASASPAAESRTVTGPVVQTRWGPVQVQIVVSGKTISDITALQLPSGSPRDQEINGYAEPIYRQQALQRQSADIDVVSGATVTWSGYTQSLQAAIDAAGL
jgi:uncharacterized protein with FMN-binding domain